MVFLLAVVSQAGVGDDVGVEAANRIGSSVDTLTGMLDRNFRQGSWATEQAKVEFFETLEELREDAPQVTKAVERTLASAGKEGRCTVAQAKEAVSSTLQSVVSFYRGEESEVRPIVCDLKLTEVDDHRVLRVVGAGFDGPLGGFVFYTNCAKSKPFRVPQRDDFSWEYKFGVEGAPSLSLAQTIEVSVGTKKRRFDISSRTADWLDTPSKGNGDSGKGSRSDLHRPDAEHALLGGGCQTTAEHPYGRYHLASVPQPAKDGATPTAWKCSTTDRSVKPDSGTTTSWVIQASAYADVKARVHLGVESAQKTTASSVARVGSEASKRVLVSGGCQVMNHDRGHYIRDSYPVNEPPTEWSCSSGAWEEKDEASLQAVAVSVPVDSVDIKVFSDRQRYVDPRKKLTATAHLKPGYELTGGGCKLEPAGTAWLAESMPGIKPGTWLCTYMDLNNHLGTVTAFAIGVRPEAVDLAQACE